MESRLYNHENYHILSEWAFERGTQAIPADILPKLCLMVWEEDRPLAFTAIHMDNSISVAMLIWTSTNPNNGPKESGTALDFLIGCARKVLADQGYSVILTVTGANSLARFMKYRGFHELETAHLMIGNV